MTANLAIETEALSRRFGSLLAVDGLALRVPVGSVFGFLGPNGAGKTTTIRMLLGLIRRDAGGVRLFGEPLATHPWRSLARVGALVEAPALYPHLTGRQCLDITRRLRRLPRSRIDEALETVGLTAAADRFVSGYSQGMRQRLGLALALLPRPELLILDEPTNGLDPAGIREMRHLIADMPARFGLTVFLSSHLLSEVEQVASHVGIINGGRLLHQGPLRDLQAAARPRLLLGVDGADTARRILAEAGLTVAAGQNGLLHVAIEDETATAKVNAMLVSAGLAVNHLQLARPGLEEIFMDFTANGVPS